MVVLSESSEGVMKACACMRVMSCPAKRAWLRWAKRSIYILARAENCAGLPRVELGIIRDGIGEPPDGRAVGSEFFETGGDDAAAWFDMLDWERK